MNKSIAPIEKQVAHGLFEPVLVTMNTNLLEHFNKALHAVTPCQSERYNKIVHIAQNEGTHIFTAYFQDDFRDYKLVFESVWVNRKGI